MTDYTLDMFLKDHDDLIPKLKFLKIVELLEAEWPQVAANEPVGKEFGLSKKRAAQIITKFEKMGLVKIVPEGYRINPNNPDYDTIGAFRVKYGPKANDFALRFLSVMHFLIDNSDRLKKEGLIKDTAEGASLIDEDLIRTMLDSFKSPETPNRFPSSPLCNKYHAFVLNRVLQALSKNRQIE